MAALRVYGREPGVASVAVEGAEPAEPAASEAAAAEPAASEPAELGEPAELQAMASEDESVAAEGVPSPEVAPVAPPPAAAPVVPPPVALRHPSRPSTLAPTLKLGAVFVGCFASSTALVLSVWFGVVRPERAAQAAISEPSPPAIVAVEPVVEPPVVAEPVAEPVDVPDEAHATLDEGEPEQVAATPAPRSARPPARPAPRPSDSARAAPVQPEPRRAEVAEIEAGSPEPEPAVARVEPQPVADPLTFDPPAILGDAVAAASGRYVGRAQRTAISLDLAFVPQGELLGMVLDEGGEQAHFLGSWSVHGNEVHFALVEQDVAEPRVLSGILLGDEVTGRITVGGRSKGRFDARR